MTVPTILTLLVLIGVVLTVIAFTFAVMNMRYVFLQQLEERIARSQEAISAGAWMQGTTVVLEIRNNVGRGVVIKTLKATIQYVYTYTVDGEVKNETLSYNKVFNNLYLYPYQAKYIVFNILDDIWDTLPDTTENVYVNYVAVIVATERNVFIFDPAPLPGATILPITRDKIGSIADVYLPNGKRARFTIYEFLQCSIGSTTRFQSIVDVLDASTILVATAPYFESVREYTYNYGYDYERDTFPSITIDITPQTTIDGVETTRCTISATGYSLEGRTVTVARGVVLIGTQLGTYDIVVYTFASNPYPELVSNLVLTGVKSHSFLTKIPLPARDISVYDFFAPQIAPYFSQDRQTTLMVGNFYSQAIIIGQSITGIVNADISSLTINVEFNDPYPIIVIIAPPPLSVGS